MKMEVKIIVVILIGVFIGIAIAAIRGFGFIASPLIGGFISLSVYLRLKVYN